MLKKASLLRRRAASWHSSTFVVWPNHRSAPWVRADGGACGNEWMMCRSRRCCPCLAIIRRCALKMTEAKAFMKSTSRSSRKGRASRFPGAASRFSFATGLSPPKNGRRLRAYQSGRCRGSLALSAATPMVRTSQSANAAVKRIRDCRGLGSLARSKLDRDPAADRAKAQQFFW